MEANSLRSRTPDPRVLGRSANPSGVSRRGRLLLVLIGLAVLAVTVLRLDGFVLAENHRDAPHTARLLQRALVARAEGDGAPSVEAADFDGLFEDALTRRQLSDHRLHEGGEVLERFGYLFRRIDTSPWSRSRGILAWPVRAGRSGQKAFFLEYGGKVWSHPNAAGHWSGLEARPDLSAPGWMPEAE